MTSTVSMSAAMRSRADRVEIALHELAVAAPLRVLAAPDRGDVIPLERRAELVPMCWATNRASGTVRSNRMPDVAPAVILKAIELLVGLVAPFAGEDFEVLQRRRVDRAEPVAAIDAAAPCR